MFKTLLGTLIYGGNVFLFHINEEFTFLTILSITYIKSIRLAVKR